MSKHETADSNELISIVGKPTPDTRYTPMKNPAIKALLEFYHLDIQEVTKHYAGLVKLGWIQPGVSKFLELVHKYADKMEKAQKRYAEKTAPKRKTFVTEDDDCSWNGYGCEYDDEDEEDEGTITILKKKLRLANTEKRKLETDNSLINNLMNGLTKALECVKPAKVTINMQKQVQKFKGQYYNILPISDVHWGEVIIPDHVNGGNEYNFEVAMKRHVELFKANYEYAKSYGCNDLNIFMLGDILAGNIHDELRESNESTIADAMARYVSFFTGLVGEYAFLYDHIDIYCVVGNHARVTKECRFKKKGIDNYEYAMYKFFETYFKATAPNVTVHTTEGTVLFANIGNQTWKLEHGDSYRGGSAFAAPFPSVARDGFKDKMMYEGMSQHFDASIIGHFHIGGETFLNGRSEPVYLNPSMVGPGEYSMKTCHTIYPASSYLFITDGVEVVDKKFVNLQRI